MSHHDELVIYLPDGRIAPPDNPYGRLIANAGTFRALAQHGGFQRLHVQSRTPADPTLLAAELGVDKAPPLITSGPLFSTTKARRSGTLLYGQPYLTEPAWVRRHAGADQDYSIVGTIFAYASAPHREQMMQAALAPIHPWDALICSSPTLAQTVAHTFDAWEHHLRAHLGVMDSSGFRLPRPQLPVIGFGTDVAAIERQAAAGDARAALRTAVGIAPDDVMVYCLGRLSYYDKAFPQAMCKAVEAAQARTGVTTHFVMTGWFPHGDADLHRYEQVARAYAPHVRTTFLDGNDAEIVAKCWAAADIFMLLSDTILETFGQALVEAMAAGLPLVVSDWDGYRSIVRHGEDGFLVPTLGVGGGALGESLALLQSLGLIAYDQYAGTVAAHTAVSVESAASALATLIESPDLRARMGDAGRRRARTTFSAPVIAAAYVHLFDELAERREHTQAAGTPDTAKVRMNPLRGDPFTDFRALPTQLIRDDLHVWLSLGAKMDPSLTTSGPRPDLELDTMFAGMRANSNETQRALERLRAADTLTVGEVLGDFPAARRPFVRMTLMWLAKAGVLEWSPTA